MQYSCSFLASVRMIELFILFLLLFHIRDINDISFVTLDGGWITGQKNMYKILIKECRISFY
jgi:hypothetical protein